MEDIIKELKDAQKELSKNKTHKREIFKFDDKSDWELYGKTWLNKVSVDGFKLISVCDSFEILKQLTEQDIKIKKLTAQLKEQKNINIKGEDNG